MITIEQATEILKENAPVAQPQRVPLMHASGRTLMEEVKASFDSPSFNNSAMDGYAVRWQDIETVAGGLPVDVTLVGESSAGTPFNGRLQRGQAIRISTGAAVPDSADTVVPVEDTVQKDDATISILQARAKHQHIRFRGEEFARGQTILEKGALLTPARIALLASVGRDEPLIIPAPRVALCITGSELVEHNEQAVFGQVRNSNGPMLHSALERDGAHVVGEWRLGDDPQKIARALDEAAEQAGVIITTGGVSVGNHDHVRAAAQTCGFDTLFWKIRQRPGKPMFAARKGNTLLVGLPGNPVSAFMGYTHYLQPLLAFMQAQPYERPMISALLQEDAANRSNRVQLNRVTLHKGNDGHWKAQLLARQASHMPTTVAHADGYIQLDINARLKAGDRVQVYTFQKGVNFL
ncbi:MAG: molybdopterin molybdenumtransferase MoeA [Calditrichaeota bacterium]|nr:MAG: molybdopterin molybdenumtransferase MoeA [Calditrichota bacterium]